MTPIEKVREDLAYWEEQARVGRQMVAAAESMIPGIRNALEALEGMEDGQEPRLHAEREPDRLSPSHSSGGEADPGAPLKGTGEEDTPETGYPLFRGKCVEQVEQALDLESPQSSEDLERFLKQYGRPFSRGAIDYALRDLRKEGRVEEAKKVGNLRYWQLRQRPTEAPTE